MCQNLVSHQKHESEKRQQRRRYLDIYVCLHSDRHVRVFSCSCASLPFVDVEMPLHFENNERNCWISTCDEICAKCISLITAERVHRFFDRRGGHCDAHDRNAHPNSSSSESVCFWLSNVHFFLLFRVTLIIRFIRSSRKTAPCALSVFVYIHLHDQSNYLTYPWPQSRLQGSQHLANRMRYVGKDGRLDPQRGEQDRLWGLASEALVCLEAGCPVNN